MNPEAIEAAKAAVDKEMRLRTYDRHAYNDDVFEEGVDDIARAALEAAAPFIATQALHDAARELGSKTEDMHGNTEWWRIIAPEWLRARAAAIRDGRA